jgi:hypothetical protein
MQKQLLLIFLSVFAGYNLAIAQCTPNPQYADSSSGVWPSIQQNLPCAFADNPNGYATTIDLKTISDTTISYMSMSASVRVKAVKIVSVTGMPDGFTFSPDKPVWENGGVRPDFTPVQGCIQIAAPAAAVQQASMANPGGHDFNLTIVVDMLVDTVIGLPIPLPVNNKWLSEINQAPLKPIDVVGYQIRVRSTTSECGPQIPSALSEVLAAGQMKVFPNPAHNNTAISFNSATAGNTTVSVFNAAGSLVEQRTVNASQGQNTLNLQTQQYANGFYHFIVNTPTNVMHGSFVKSAN